MDDLCDVALNLLLIHGGSSFLFRFLMVFDGFGSICVCSFVGVVFDFFW